MRRPHDWLVLIALSAAAAYFVYVWSWADPEKTFHPIDIYYYYYANMLQAVRAVRDHGAGLLWNATQSCGQPFLGISSTGLLYPANVFFLLSPPDVALRLVIAFNLTVAGMSAYWLGRELGLRVFSAFCGAMAFAYSNASVNVTTWTPLVSSPFVWLPAILLGCERVLRLPSAGRGIVLGLVISVALLPGFPQTVFFAYQLIALRVLWELGWGRVSRPLTTLGAIGIGLCLPPLLTAVQLLPGVEMARLGIRGASLTGNELGAGLDWSLLLKAIAFRREVGNPVILVPCLLASCCFINPGTRRVAAFYALSGLLYFALAFGAHSPLFALYTQLPLGALFRMPNRFIWITGFCLALLVACGVEALVPATGTSHSPRRRIVVGLLLLVSLLGLWWLHGGLSPAEWGVAAVTVAAALVATPIPALRIACAVAVGVALALNLFAFRVPALGSLAMRPLPISSLVPPGESLSAAEPVFAELRSHLTPNDRVYSVYLNPGMGRGHSLLNLGPKTAGVFGVPAIHDYEPQSAQRFASYYMFMRTGRIMRRASEYYLQPNGMMPVGFKRRLLDLAAARFLVVEVTADVTDRLNPPPILRWGNDDLRLYENPQAFPRAFYVPRVEIVANPDQLLRRLADGSDDLAQVALVEEAPPSAFVGASGTHDGAAVEFLRNDPEHVVLRVHAPARGFVHLADQHFPGWTATVDGEPTAIMRANYLFRLVEVPSGVSVVEFRYQPWSVRIGAVISALTLAAVGSVLWARRRAGTSTR